MAAHRMRDIRCNNKRSVPPSAWRHLQPKSRPPLRKEGKKKRHSHTRRSTCKNPQSLVDKTHRIKSTSELEFCRSPSHFCFFFFSLLQEKRKFILRRWLKLSSVLMPRALAQKLGIYVLAPLLMKMRSGWKLSQWILPMAIQTELLMWGINSPKLDLFHLDGG